MTFPKLLRHITPLVLLAVLPALTARADPPKPFLHPLFTDNMVLQRGIADPVWGWTTPGMGMKVSFRGKTTAVVSGTDGKWTAKIGPFPAGGPYTLTVEGPYLLGADGKPLSLASANLPAQRTTLKNVMVGDVWLCSGQSNMEFGVGNLAQPEQTITAANVPNLRLFTVPKTASGEPQALTTGHWDACTPDTIKTQGTWSGFSAVAYFFGRELQAKTHVPIGLLSSSWGGTPAEAWTSEAALRKNVPDFNTQLDAQSAARRSPLSYPERVAAWYTKNDPGTAANWQAADFNSSGWKTLTLPGYFEDSGIPELKDVDGVVWYRKTFDLPAGDIGRAAVLHFLADDNDAAWINGTQVGATIGAGAPRSYAVPASLLKPTGNVVAVRVLDTGGQGGIEGDAPGLNLEVPGGTTLPLAGPWQVHLGVTLTAAAPLPLHSGSDQNQSASLFNGQISPLLPFGIKGAIWYQGEANADRAAQYRRLLPAMIGDWRGRWGEGDFPFLIVQLAGWEPGGPNWADLRESQWRTALSVPNSGIAAAIDIGDQSDIHPKDKEDVGHRLALVAEAKVYGQAVPYAGPVYKSLTITGQSAVLTFTHTDGGLSAQGGGPLTAFEIAGAEGVFVPADARIAGNTVVVSSPKVQSPSAVRYAWSGFPVCSLYNGAGLPAFPFSTTGK